MLKTIVLCLALSAFVVDAWPRVVRSQGWYQCCCSEENPNCPVGCFLCRNYVYSCDCSLCSCYTGDDEQEAVQHAKISPKKELLQMLLRSGFGGGRFKRNADTDDVMYRHQNDYEGIDDVIDQMV